MNWSYIDRFGAESEIPDFPETFPDNFEGMQKNLGKVNLPENMESYDTETMKAARYNPEYNGMITFCYTIGARGLVAD